MSAERFLAFVVPTTEADCWVWEGGNTGRYGIFYFRGRQDYAHRASHEMFKGPIPEGYHIDHLCRNTLCVNPAHLEAVTPQENYRRERLTHCAQGHERTPDNVIGRHCRTCRNAWKRAAYARKKENV